MSNINVSGLFVYPIKSTFRVELDQAEVERDGLKGDRGFAVINPNHKIITARENENLYKIRATLDQNNLVLRVAEHGEMVLPLSGDYETTQNEVGIFRDFMGARVIHHNVNDWISSVIGEAAQLVKRDEEKLREMKRKHNARKGDVLRFQDASAIHLITESSVRSLNEQIETPVTAHHFRANIVLKGTEAYEEDHWKQVKIGNCLFDVAVKTARCPMITINPETIAKSQQQEPLRTLASLRKENNKVNFGIYLIPRSMGEICIGDEVEVGLE